eukprot:CAMPEP_0115887646 /NCGR_PEP_ID=MMETSP0287-20121206/31872_1 /TAXON_ID=412157 /ORGANISM="Chrysochromulina rotalis, Strain UIO044" /LENGTH=41 /DNA_ID= /DNA_START= /DNA_END= /DNA_ORIENTATION=
MRRSAIASGLSGPMGGVDAAPNGFVPLATATGGGSAGGDCN